MSQMMVLVLSLLLVFIFTKNQNDLSVCAALITINVNSCYFIVNFLSGGVGEHETALVLLVCCSVCCAEWHNDMCVLCRLI